MSAWRSPAAAGEARDAQTPALIRETQVQRHFLRHVGRERWPREHDAVATDHRAGAVSENAADTADAITARGHRDAVGELDLGWYRLVDARRQRRNGTDEDDDRRRRTRIAVDVDGGCIDGDASTQRRVGREIDIGIDRDVLVGRRGDRKRDRGVQARGPRGLARHTDRDALHAVWMRRLNRHRHRHGPRNAVAADR
jgi:hypothetical protein